MTTSTTAPGTGSAALPPTADVLVVGAGPTGLTMATALRTLGVDVVVVDLEEKIRTKSGAVGVQPRTLEQLARIGAADTLVARGLKARDFRAVDRDEQLLDVSFTDLDTPYPFVLQAPQDVTEEAISDALHAAGGQVLRGWRVLSVAPEFDADTVSVADPEGVVHVVRARYVVGCDGLHSGVRASTGASFDGEQDAQDYAIADVEIDGGDELSDVTFCFSPKGLLLISPLPDGLTRLVATVPEPVAVDVAAAQALVDERAPTQPALRVERIAQSSPYRVSTRLAGSFGGGRTFVAGDAAHVHSPAGGQGMNTGIQDAVNLSWKLADVLAGAPPDLLETYDAERRPNGEALLAFTAQITDLAEITDPATVRLRNEMLQAAGATEQAPAMLSSQLSQLAVGYSAGRAAGPGGIAVGDRVPPDGSECDTHLRWCLRVPVHAKAAAEQAVAGTGAHVTAHEGDAALLVRPDGYLGAASDDVSEDALRALVGARHA